MCLFTNAVFVLHPGQILPRSGCNGTPGNSRKPLKILLKWWPPAFPFLQHVPPAPSRSIPEGILRCKMSHPGCMSQKPVFFSTQCFILRDSGLDLDKRVRWYPCVNTQILYNACLRRTISITTLFTNEYTFKLPYIENIKKWIGSMNRHGWIIGSWEKSLIVFLKLLFISKEPQNSVSVHGLFVYTCFIYIQSCNVCLGIWLYVRSKLISTLTDTPQIFIEERSREPQECH